VIIGHRHNRTLEVRGSIPLISTRKRKGLAAMRGLFVFRVHREAFPNSRGRPCFARVCCFDRSPTRSSRCPKGGPSDVWFTPFLVILLCAGLGAGLAHIERCLELSHKRVRKGVSPRSGINSGGYCEQALRGSQAPQDFNRGRKGIDSLPQ